MSNEYIPDTAVDMDVDESGTLSEIIDDLVFPSASDTSGLGSG